MKKTNWKKSLCLTVLTVCMAFGLTACNKEMTDEEILANMKEFVSESETVAIHLDQDWKVEELGMPNWIGAQNELGTDAVMVIQAPKTEYSGALSSVDDLKNLMDEAYQFSNEQTVEAPAVPGVSNVTASTCELSYASTKFDGYVIFGESDYAYYMLCYAANNFTDAKKQSFNVSCGTFKETAKEEENNFSTEMTNTIRWFNATYAILTRTNQCNVNYFGGFAANDANCEEVKEMLDGSWGVTDRATADETMDWILTEGHRTTYKENMKSLEEAGIKNVAAEERKAFIEENFIISSDEAEQSVALYANYEQYGENALDAWDYCRALSLAAWFYHAGYYTEQEALDKSMEIAQMMQPLYASWDEAMNSYLLGYEYWAEESADERRAVYEELKAEEDSIYNVDWNLAFEKTW